MIEVKDRSVQYPNRYQLTTVAGQSNTYDLTPVPGTIAEEGTPVNKALLDQYLAASGTTAGTASALTLAQSGFSLTDGAYVRARLHTAIKNSATLNVNGTGAKSVVAADGKAPYLSSGSYLVVVYSSASGKYHCLTEGSVTVSGSYTGDNSESRTISLPFTPSAVLLRRDQLSCGTSTTVWNLSHLAVTGAPSYNVDGKDEMLSVTTNGFKVYRPSSANNAGCTNASNATWHYIAFK